MSCYRSFVRFLISLFKSRSSLALEVAALQHQIMVLKGSVKQPKISNSDRMFWVVLRIFWPNWRKALVIVQPSTVINWHPKIGIRVSDSTVRKYKPLIRKPPSQTWLTFLRNHMKHTVAIDFFVVPTIGFRLLYLFMI